MFDYADVFQDAAAAARYDEEVYAPGGWAAAVDRRQRVRLRRWLRGAFPAGTRPVQHDFACGTGRVLTMFDGLVAGAHGYDTSATMLARARARPVPGELHLISEGGPAEPVATGSPVLVTLFRFLLNAPPEGRAAALAFAARALPDRDAGYLLVENHGPSGSLRGLGRRRHRSDRWFAELSHRRVADLLAGHGFTIVGRHGFGLAPAGSYRQGWSRPLARTVDALAGRIPHAAVATAVVYVARRFDSTYKL
jgi:SAM-dependent methyltransferase